MLVRETEHFVGELPNLMHHMFAMEFVQHLNQRQNPNV